MPVMAGAEATQILKEMMDRGEIVYTPIVAVSAARCDNEEEKQQYLSAGFDDFSIFRQFCYK